MNGSNYSRRTFVKTSALAAISVSPAVNALSQVFGVTTQHTKLLVDCGFRLTNWKNLLNLEFYFVNVDYKDNNLFRKRKLLSRYSQQESYMIVRLPQQHIAEQSYSVPVGQVAPENDWRATTMISGYSYLVFRIMFDIDEDKKKIPLTPSALMDWNNRRNFKLVVRQNLTESLFEIQINTDDNFENSFPFGYEKQRDGTYKHSYDRFPKAYGDPITALEFPWRLILSPKLPDQDRFMWHWEFSKEPTETISKVTTEAKRKTEAELWTASLTITENPEYNKRLELRKKYQAKYENENSKKHEVEEIINKIELIIIGCADTTLSSEAKKKLDAIFETSDTYILKTNSGQTITKAQYLAKSAEEQEKYYCKYKILPKVKDREDLLELYIKYKLVARANKITFSPIGVSTFLELKNTKIKETSESNSKNNLFSWKQLISFGRDEEVEIIRLFVDKEFGHKWLHIYTTKRRTKKGLSYLDYREYIMPLEIEKDYTAHINESQLDINSMQEYSTSKFNTPFKKIQLLETKPKRIFPLENCTEAILKFGNNAYAYIPQVFDLNQDNKHDFVEFQYLATDWQDQTITIRKKIQAIQYNAFDFINAKSNLTDRNAELKKIESLFSSDKIDELEKSKQAYSSKYNSIIQLFAQMETVAFKPAEQLNRYKNLISSTKIYTRLDKELPLLNDAIIAYLEDFNSTLEVYSEQLGNLLTALKIKSDAIITFIRSKTVTLELTETAFESLLTDLENQIKLISNQKLATIRAILIGQFNELSFKDLRSSVKLKVEGVEYEIKQLIKEKVLNDWNKIYQAEKAIPNLIRTFRQKIGYAVEDVKTAEQELLDGIRDEVSILETDYLVFKGELKRELETSRLDFFNQYASVPQLKQAKAYVKSLNKLVNEEVPVSFKYATDYLENQIDQNKLEIEGNVSKVFAEVTESSREYLKGKIRHVASEMGGYLNPEIPVEFLTYLKDTKKIPDKLRDELLKQYPDLEQYNEEIKDGYNDLIFISEAAKDQWKEIKQIHPDAFFKGLEAKILGSISLKDILGLDFEVPRLSELPDKIVYNFQTDKIRNQDFSIVKFYGKNRGKQAALQVYLEKETRNPSNYKSFTRLSNFSIAIRLASQDVLLILFDKLEVSSSNSKAKKTDVKIDDVSFGGQLNFLGKLAEAIKMPGTGLRVMPSISQVEIGYTFALPSIETPAFNLANLKFDIGLRIPYPTSEMVKPITTTFSINRPYDKFLVAVGIFGGRGHFVLEATPDKIVSIDASIEFGGYFGINLGIASGHVYLFAGIRYQCSGGDLIFTGYVICGGGVTVFGFISVSVTFFLAMTYQDIGGQATLYGSASVRYSVKIGFFKKSFTLRYSKRITGAKGKTVDPNSENSTAYLDRNEEPVYYASVSDEMMVSKGKSFPESDLLNAPQAEDERSFKIIYPKSSGLWESYCKSFNFE
ncbi:hypothetical protein [Flavobacterium beibuense]|uniref:hypothetical protein n=1 Tax=Flavobacterium beibuense TaxID=657326 RepID=UPI003A90F76D